MRGNFNSLAIFEVRQALRDGERCSVLMYLAVMLELMVGFIINTAFYLLVHNFSFDIMQHLGSCSISDTSIWKGSVSSRRQCERNISFPAVKVRATAARPPLCFMLSRAYLHS